MNNKRPRRNNYSVNVKGPRSGKKVENAIKHFKILQNRIEREGETLWIRNALVFVKAKLKKYSIPLSKIS